MSCSPRSVCAVIFILFAVTTASAKAQDFAWTNLTFDQANDLTGVSFITDSKGLVVGPNETIYSTTNGGQSFSFRSVFLLDAEKCCRSVRYLDASNAWIGGKAAVLRSTNGGSSWGGTQITGIGGSVDRWGIAGVSSTTAWQVGGSHYRYTISAGGGSVSSRSWGSSNIGLLRDIQMFDPDNGISVGEDGEIVLIADGSFDDPDFDKVSSGTTRDLNAIHMLNSLTGWIAGKSGTILKTTDGGKHWTKKTTGTTADLNDVSFRDQSVGWAVGASGLILLSLDGGNTWLVESSGTSADLLGVAATASYAYAVGAAGTFLKRDKLGMLLFDLSPTDSPSTGGGEVTISGIGFDSGARVFFGDAESPRVTFVSPSELLAVVPQHGTGLVDIAIVNLGGESATLADAFRYTAGARRRSVMRPD